jgi:hypothetical protein
MRELTRQEQDLVAGGFVFNPPLPANLLNGFPPTGTYKGLNYIVNSGNGLSSNGSSTFVVSQSYSFGGNSGSNG